MRDRWTLTRINPLSLTASLLVLLVVLGDERIACIGLQYQPLETYTPSEECALILNGPGRTSVYDYTYNLLRGSFPASVGNAQTCITYEAVNRAYLEARKRINVAQPKTEKWRPEDLATVGELLLDISRSLAHTYGLTTEEIEKSLPLIDTSKTLINEVCPAFLSNVECRPGKYRRYDGLCTNLQNPTWGSSLSPFTRLLPPRFADGLSAPRISVTGRDLPLSRVVSRTMHPDEGFHDHAGTVMVIAWGQFMDHDYTLTATPLDPLNRNDPEECCSRPPHLRNPYCNEIVIPEDDYFYRLFNVKCIDFVRAFPAVRPGCRLGSRVPFNLLTGVLDGNTVYGISDEFSRKLRSGYGGLLRMNPVFAEYGLKDLLPLKLDIPDEGCTRPNRSMYCFEAGEIRVNEQLVLTCMHTLMAREHNRVAKGLAQVNPHWDDETLFQEARRIIIAQIQHVTYNEFLPILLGKDVMEKFGLLLEKDGYWDGYDPTINPGVIDAFASAAFRFGHSLLPTAVERWSKAHKFIASKRLSDLIRRPYDLYRAGVLDEYFMGLMNQVAQAMDDSITQEVTNHLFKKVGAKFGMDLVSFNMQRGREFGIPSYMEFRKFCGLPGADSFEELFGSMPNETIRRYSSIFQHPSDVDLWSGGVSERPLPGSMLGPTFACVIATQFSYSRRGDRFWYELPNQPSSFTPGQLKEIRKTKLAKLICDNTDLIDTIQIYPMVLPDHEINPRVPCRSGVLPGIDFSKWAEFPASAATNTARYNSIKMTQDVSSSAANPVLGDTNEYIEKKLSSTFLEKVPVFSKKSKTWPFEIPNLKKFFPSTYRRVVEQKIVLQNIEIDSEEPDEITKLSTIVELIREKNKKRELNKKRKNQKRKTNKKVKNANVMNFETSGQETKNKFTEAIIKKKSNFENEKNLGKSQNSLDFSKMFQKIPSVDSSRGIIEKIVEKAQLLSFLENLYRQSFPENVVRKILKKYTAKDLVEKSFDSWIRKIKDKVGNPEKSEKNKMINVMIINTKDQKNIEEPKPRTKRSAENTAVDLKSQQTLEKLYRQSFPEEVVRQIIEKYSEKNLLKKREENPKDQVGNLEESSKNKTENIVVKNSSENAESSKLNSLKIHVKRSAKKIPVDSTLKTSEPKVKIQEKNPKVAIEGLYRHPRLTYEDQRDSLPEILSTNPPIVPKIQLQITTPRSDFLYQRIWDIINDTQSGWPDKDSYKVTNNASTLKNVESQRLEKPYVPVLSDCKDVKAATASEVADLTAPTKKFQSVETKKAEEDDKVPRGIPGYPGPSTEKLKEFIPSPRQSEALSWKPISVLDRKDIYANLQDHQSTTARDAPTYPPDIPPYNPDKIPYVDVPDYSDQREESLDKDEPVRKLKEEPDVIDPTEDRVDDAKLVEKSSDDEDDDEERGGKVLSVEKSSGPRVGKSGKLTSDEKIPRRRSDDAEEDKKPEESGKVQKEESAEDFEVHFDINEYRKPFNFEEFLKNDPIFKELRTTQDDEDEDEEKDEEKEETKEDRPNHKLKTKEIPVHEDEKKDDYTDPEEYKGSSESVSNEKYDYHKPSANENYGSVDHGNYTDDSKEDLEERVTEDEFRYGDKDFFKPIFSKRARSTDNAEDKGEDEFVSRYFSEDVKRKLRESLDQEAKGEQDEAENQKKIYKTLTTVTDEKGDKEEAEEDGKSPHKYKKYWLLEYGFPRKNGVNSKQEKKH